jgi:serine/threonine protein kinase
MEDNPGGELSDRLEERALSVGDARLYFVQVVFAFCHVQQKTVVYRDLSYIISFSTGPSDVKPVDFGFAHVCERPDEMPRGFCGTPEDLAQAIIQKNVCKTTGCRRDD